MSNSSYSIASSFNSGWKKFKEKPILYLGITALIFTISLFSSNSYESIMHYPDIVPPSYDLTTFFAQVLYTYLSLGFMKAAILHMRGEDIDFNSFFQIKLMNIIHYVIATILSSILTMIGLIFLIIPGIHIGLRLVLTSCLIIDKNINFVDAIEESWNITKGKTIDLFLWSLLAFIIILLGLLALVLGLFIAMPVVSIAFAYMYVKITNTERVEKDVIESIE